MKTASGYYTIHWDCPECGIHNEDLERDLNKSEDRLIGFCGYCCSNLIIDVEEQDSDAISTLSIGTPIHPGKIYELMAYNTETGECDEYDVIDTPFIPAIQYEIPKLPTITFRYENWDLEGTLHMKDVHNSEFAMRIGKMAHSDPALCRRLEKRGDKAEEQETVI